ncbi:MAG: histidine phosphatase family protein [Oscillospiraceae bacterium]
MKIVFIRHGKTKGNLEKRYIGKTDESVLPFGSLDKSIYPKISAVYTSDKKRCIQTANAIYPHIPLTIVDNISECDFGDFEGKNYDELKNVDEYKKYIQSGGKISPPNGENIYNFKKRCYNGYRFIISHAKNSGYNEIAIVTHGGVIMSIFEKFSDISDFYFWQIGNLDYIEAEITEEKITSYKIIKIG